MEEDAFIVNIGGEEIKVNKKVCEVSQYLHNILSLGIDEEEVNSIPFRFKSIHPL